MITSTNKVSSDKPAAIPSNTHLNFLDGVRALAAIFVVLHHAWLDQRGIGTLGSLQGLETNWLSYGHLAVDVFIVLSGFCLILPVTRTGELRGGALNFFRKRARRILPPLYAAIGFSWLLRWVLTRHPVWHLYWPHFKYSLVANFLLVQDLLPKYNDVDPPLWTVAVEYKIYFLFPALVLIWKRYGPGATVVTAAAITGILMAGFHLMCPQLSLEHICPWYVFLFSMGICGGTVAVKDNPDRNWRLFAVVLASLLASSLLLFPIAPNSEGGPYTAHLPLIDVLTGALTACLLIILTQKARTAKIGGVLAVLNWRPLTFVGTFAYSLYLIHFPLLVLLLTITGHVHLPAALVPHHIALFNAVALPVIIGCAYVFFLLFEQPFLSSRPRRAIAKEDTTGLSSL